MGGLFIDVWIRWLVNFIRKEVKIKRARKWPVADAEILRSRIVDEGFKGYRPVADYSFQINAETYYGLASGHCQNNERAADLSDMIIPGSRLKVRYDFAEPAKNLVLNADNPDFRVEFEE